MTAESDWWSGNVMMQAWTNFQGMEFLFLCVMMETYIMSTFHINAFKPRQNGCHFPYGIFNCIFLNWNVWISMKSSLKFVLKGWFNHIPALVQIMAWSRSGNKPLSEPMMVSLLMHICITRPQWVNGPMHKWVWPFTYITIIVCSDCPWHHKITISNTDFLAHV